MHRWILHTTGGRLFAKVGKLSVLLLYTKGRKSGEERMNGLSFVPFGDGYAVVASNAGADFHPGWWLNLREMPDAEIQVRGQRMKVKWRAVTGQEREEIFAKFVEAEPGYAEYRKRTKREIPVVVLEPIK
jgi:deazaflavin-dependent oxidoreductase (nitroreductase family)